MQTKFGIIAAIAIAIVVVVLCWTCNLTGWFDTDNFLSLPWAYLSLGTLVALGAAKLVDRRIWAVRLREEIAAEKTENEKHQAEIAEIHAQHDHRVQANNLSVIETLKEPIVGPPYSGQAAAAQ